MRNFSERRAHQIQLNVHNFDERLRSAQDIVEFVLGVGQ